MPMSGKPGGSGGACGRLARVFEAIDAANAHDPAIGPEGPEALVYGRRMSAELDRLFPDAGELLQIAARGQHIERWTIPRSDYPEGRSGYLAWRRDLGRFHGDRVAEIMHAEGYAPQEAARVAAMLRKEGLKRDREVQALEDVICLVFLKHHFAPFAATQPADRLLRIVRKTARKMSSEGRARVLREFDLPGEFAAAFRD